MRTRDTTNTPTAIVKHPWRSLWLLLLPTAVVALGITVLFLAVPALTTDLTATPVQQLWITDVYALIVGVMGVYAET